MHTVLPGYIPGSFLQSVINMMRGIFFLIIILFHTGLFASKIAPVTIDEATGFDSSRIINGNSASYAFDNNAETRWESNGAEPISIEISLRKEHLISSIRILWETASAAIYEILVLKNNEKWESVAAVSNGRPGEDRLIKFSPVKTRGVKIVCKKKSTQWGYSIWEIEINPKIRKPETYYVDATGGNDNNEGTSPEKAWNSIQRVNRTILKSGDKVLFKRGGVFRGFLNPASGSTAGYIIYADYGTGNKPRILGSLNKNRQSDWSNIEGNIWIHSSKDKNSIKPNPDDLLSQKSDRTGILWPEIGNIIFDHEKSCGRKRYSLGELKRQDDFYFDESAMDLYMFSIGNPAEVHTQIECAPRDFRERINSLTLTNKSYVIFENIDWRYYGTNLTYYGANSHHIVIRRCEEHYCGGARQPGLSYSKTMRFGGGLSSWDNAHDYLIEGNLIRFCYDGALSFETAGDNVEVYNMTYINNIIMNSEMGFSYFIFGKNSHIANVLVANNTFINCGYSWGSDQRPDGQLGLGINDFGVNSTAKIENFRIVNNVVYNARHYALRFQSDAAALDYNIYFSTSGELATFRDKWYEFYSYDQLTQYKNFLRQDANSLVCDPLIDANGAPLDGSPCIDSGKYIAEVKYDYFGNPRNSKPDIGAIEFIK